MTTPDPLPPKPKVTFNPITWPQFFCLLGMHDHQYAGLEYAGDGRQVVKTECIHCKDVDYGSQLIGLRIERKGRK